MEHLGISDKNYVNDPLDPKLMVQMTKQAEANTLAYRRVFACCPDDKVLSNDLYRSFFNTNNKYDMKTWLKKERNMTNKMRYTR